MNAVNLEKFIVDDIIVRNRLKEGKIELRHNIRYNVNFAKDRPNCIGILTIEVGTDAPDSPLYLLLKIRGFFSCTCNDKRKIHVESLRELFPQGRSIISCITGISNLPPLMIQTPTIKEEDVDINFNSDNNHPC